MVIKQRTFSGLFQFGRPLPARVDHLSIGLFLRCVAPLHATTGWFFPEGEGTVVDTELEREQLLEALGKIALSKPNDAISLALHPEKRMSGLDLWGVAEFKKGSNGNIEIKFTDRVKAISLLLEALGGGEDGMAALLDALDSCDAEESDS